MSHRRIPTVILLLSMLLAPATTGVAQEYPSPTGIVVLAPYFPQGYWWDHPTLTVHVKAGGNVDQASVDAMWAAVAIWNEAISSRGVTLVPVGDEPGAGAKADIVVNLHAQGGSLFGVANCRSGKRCQVMAWDHERANANSINAIDLTYDDLVSLAVHELGHALGVGHVEPLYGTLDVMGYGTETILFPPAEISACNLLAFDAAWEWLITGSAEPYPPTTNFVYC